MEGFRVFTWDAKNYDAPGVLFDEINAKGVKPVTIIDPGTKKDPNYYVNQEGIEKGYFATDKEGEVYVNVVWPGESHYPDFGREEVRNWWSDKHKILTDMGVAGIWNDMNEPASFNGELPGDVVFYDEDRKTCHDEMHNVYGHLMSKATYEGLKDQTGKRPFVITRACYAGTQKYSTVWTGDNQSLWSHLQMMVPQLCNLGLSGFAFCGADAGGFGADCTPELMSRWIEAAAFSPLFRNHAAKGARKQEPWRFGEEVVNIYRKYVELRYRFLPYIYDLFYEGETTGLPVMRPLVLHYPHDKNVRNLNGEFLVGEHILVAPVMEQGAVHKMVYLPEGTWYDYWTGEKLEGNQFFLREAAIDVCPIYIKAGSIIPTYEVMQYVEEKPYDTLTLLTTPGEGYYEHFQDNGSDYAYQNGEYNLYAFTQDETGNLVMEMKQEGYPAYKHIEIQSLVK
jgi:alpha-glucosidase